MSRRVQVKGAALVSVALLLAAVAILLTVPPARRYELSVYGAYPWYFWACVVGAAFVGLQVIVVSASIEDDGTWAAGLAVVLLTNAMLFLMPFIRGYYGYGRSDPMSHLGFAHDIVAFGIGGENIYPKTHILLRVVARATGLEEMVVTPLIPALFSVVYFGGMFFLLTHLFDSRKRILFALPFAALPVLGDAHLLLRPFDLSLLLVPLVFYLFVKAQQRPLPSIRSAFVVVLIGILMYHPLTALFLIGLFVAWLVSKHVPLIEDVYRTPTNLVSLAGVVFLAWYSNYASIIIRFEKVYMVLFGQEEGEAPVEGYAETVQETAPALVDLARVATFRYGVDFLLFGLGFAFVAVALTLLVQRAYEPDAYTAMFAATVVLFSTGGLAFLVSDLLVSHERPFKLAKIFATVLAGQLFFLLWHHVDWQRHRLSVLTGFHASLTLVLLVLVTLSIVTVFPAPPASESNDQVTQMELEGSAWVAERGQASGQLLEAGMNYRRFYEAQYGKEVGERYAQSLPPVHFNYTERQRLGQSYEDDVYLTITRRGRIVYPRLFPDYPEDWRYTPGDLQRLERDPSVARVYANGDYDQYLVQGSASPPPDDGDEADADDGDAEAEDGGDPAPAPRSAPDRARGVAG